MNGGASSDRENSIVWIDPQSQSELADTVTIAISPLRRVRRRTVLLTIGLTLCAVAATIMWTALRSTEASLTINGASIADPRAVLDQAQTRFAAFVTANAGVTIGAPRCYFERPAPDATSDAGGPADAQPSNARSSDVLAAVLCGPVAFYNGSADRPYLRYSLRPGTVSHGSVALVVAATPDSPGAVAAAAGARLVRPDGTSSPVRTVHIPVPAPASVDMLQSVDDVYPARLPDAPRDAVIGSDSTTVTLDNAGPITTFGAGASERSAPKGQRLIAFALEFGSGENTAAPLTSLRIGVSVDGAPAMPLPDASGGQQARRPPLSVEPQLFAVAVPIAATSVDLVVEDAGYTQRLSLLTGVPAPSNITVLRSNGAFRNASATGAAIAQVRDPGPLTARLAIALDGAGMYFFLPKVAVHPSSTNDAFLYLDLCYRSADLNDGGVCHPFRPTDVTVTPTGHPAVRGRYLSLNGSAEVMYEVPADMTSATLTIGGSESGDGFWMTIQRPVTIAFSLSLVTGINR